MALIGRTPLRVSLSDSAVSTLRLAASQSQSHHGDSDKEDHEALEVVQRVIGERCASVDDVKFIVDTYKGRLKVHELLCSCEIVLPEPIYEKRNPVLQARIDKLNKLFEQRSYNQMTKNIITRARDPDDSLANQLRFMDKQLIAVAQFIFSVGSGFAFGFYGVELMVGDLDFGFRLLLGVICSLVIALAEIYFLAKIIAELDVEGVVKTPSDEDIKSTVNAQETQSSPTPPPPPPPSQTGDTDSQNKPHQD